MDIQGISINIREKRLEDAETEYQWRIDPELSELDASRPLVMGYEEFLRVFKGQFDYPTPWVKRLSVDTKSGIYIGNIMYYDIDTVNKEAEIGIMIGNREYWGQGYGFDILVTLIDHIFSNTSLKRLYLHTLDWNHRAQRCFAKCGFKPIKKIRRISRNFILMEVYYAEWEKIRDEKLAERVSQQDRGT